MIRLRQYQQTAVDEIRAAFMMYKRVLLVSPTGSGKTVMFSYLARAVRAKGRRVYILVHRDELVEQVSDTLKAFGVEHGIIAAGRPATASPVQVASVFTLVNRASSYPAPDMLIVDEAHHASKGSTWSRVFSTWPAAYVLGVTATPIRLDGKPLTFFEHMVMGPTPADLMELGSLCGYTMYAPPLAIGKLKMRMGDYEKTSLKAEMDKPQLVGNAVEHYRSLAAGRRAVAFCVSLEHAANTAIAFNAAGFPSARLDGGLDRGVRRGVVDRFRSGELKVITSCDLISEGFDLPSIEVAILMRPTASLGMYLQQVGRSLRPFDGKDRALILDHAGNAGKHGLPDDDREWSLEGEQGCKRKATARDETQRKCGRCYAYVVSGTTVCPYCRWEWPIKSREVKEAEGELVKVESKPVSGLTTEQRAKRREIGMANTFEELQAIASARGYKPGWARHVWESKRGRREASG